MTDYLLMVLENEDAHAAQPPKAMAELIERRAQFVEQLRRTGELQDTGRLRPSAEGKRVRMHGGQVEVTHGPFGEDGKALCAYSLVKGVDLEQAAKLAAAYPGLPSDVVDVRPVMKGAIDAEKEAKPGKIFALAVLGNTPTEAEWVGVMDRIDSETSGCFPPDSFLGGIRLEPPKVGRRVATRGERRATFDGPFMESKGVIGGLFFLRMSDMSEAVRWASKSRFVVHGALEIRELWRS